MPCLFSDFASRYLVNCVNHMGCIVVWTNLSLCLIKYPTMSLYRVVKNYFILGIKCHGSCIAGGRTLWVGPTAGVVKVAKRIISTLVRKLRPRR